jgi:circadian clock protein KaiC
LPLPNRSKNGSQALTGLEKTPTGIKGLDEISGGGLPKGRITIVCGGPGCGKTMLGLEFLSRGVLEFDEPGVLMAFEESPKEMARNVVSLGFDLEEMARRKKLFLDYVYVEPSEIQETGDYDLEGLFIRLQSAIEAVGAKRVVLDTLEALFSGFKNTSVLRAEIRRLFRWLSDRNLTTVVTAEKGEATLTRYGLEEYVSDCVILLDHRIIDEVSTRRMRIVKYRGTSHSADEFPFLIDRQGLSVLPITSLELRHDVSDQRVPTGIADLDEMLEGKGYYRGSSILVSGTSGSGKTTLAGTFAEATCRRGERCLYIAFEESAQQVARNLRSVGVDLQSCIDSGRLIHQAWRPTQYGIEMHLLRIHNLIEQVKPDAIVIDPITNLINSGDQKHVYSMLMRLLDYLKGRQITALLVSLTKGGESLEHTEVGISSLIDTWLLLRDIELNGERNRCIYVLKSRGMAHSNQLREFIMSREGIQLLPAYVGDGGVLTGSSRIAQEAREQLETDDRKSQIERLQTELDRKERVLEAQIESLRAQFAAEAESIKLVISQGEHHERELDGKRDAIANKRRAGAELAKSAPAGASR